MKLKTLVFFFIFLFPVTVMAQDPVDLFEKPLALKSENGRYVFGQTSMARADQFMLDTKTGRLWQLTTNPTAQLFGISYLVPVVYESFDEAYTAQPKPEFGPKPPKN